MKIVVVGTRGIPDIQGGVETHCEELYPRLVQKGCEVTVVRRSCYVNGDNCRKEYKGVSLHDLYAPRKKSLEAIVHTFLAVLYARRRHADVLHIHAIGPSFMVPFARLLGLRVVMTHHGPDYDRKKWGKLARFVLKTGERWGVKYANRVIVISNVIRRLIEEKYHRMDTDLVYNGITTIPQSSSENGLQEPGRYLREYGLSSKMYVIALGRFVEEKGFDLLIKAFSACRQQYEVSTQSPFPFRLVIAGDADHETEYSKRLCSLAAANQVVLTGFIRGSRLAELMSHAALFVLPSFHEGLPISLLEAMGYHLPVLVSDIPANKEVALPADDYFSCGNVLALQEALQKKLADNAASCEYDLTKYDWDHIADQVLSIYQDLATH